MVTSLLVAGHGDLLRAPLFFFSSLSAPASMAPSSRTSSSAGAAAVAPGRRFAGEVYLEDQRQQ